MASIHGSNGIVKNGSDAIARVNDFSIEESAEFADDMPMGETERSSNETAITAWSASINCQLDESDTNGQLALTAGASITFKGYTEGDGSGKAEYSGTLRITGRTISEPKDGIVTLSITGQGSGALTRSLVPA